MKQDTIFVLFDLSYHLLFIYLNIGETDVNSDC